LSLNKFLAAAVETIVNAGLLPLASIFIEPAKILFLNNAINHGILGPLGVEQVTEMGKSIFFLLETNPGPGLGVLLAYWLIGKGMAKESAPGAIVIHFFGGIHEIYFPYVLMNPILLLAVILGGGAGVFTFVILGAGLVATPSPGSIFAELAMTPKGGYLPVLAGIGISALVSFLMSSVLLKRFGSYEDESIQEAQERVDQLKGKRAYSAISKEQTVNKIVFACDGGMGSSAMGASILRKKIKEAGLNIKVVNVAIHEIPGDADIVIAHRELSERVQAASPKAEHIFIEAFVNNPIYDEIVENLKK
ncbi:MAG: PTS mannitol transporter subunit IICB, partial [Thermoanaerobacteraceae bacterium]|nr:PTS mannitol transporter subunit IICB [Thermoanaerobacteraceae bacterium]